jgi:hypothetical protein
VVSCNISKRRGLAIANIGRAIAVNLGIISSSSVWTNTDTAYYAAFSNMLTDDKCYIFSKLTLSWDTAE